MKSKIIKRAINAVKFYALNLQSVILSFLGFNKIEVLNAGKDAAKTGNDASKLLEVIELIVKINKGDNINKNMESLKRLLQNDSIDLSVGVSINALRNALPGIENDMYDSQLNEVYVYSALLGNVEMAFHPQNPSLINIDVLKLLVKHEAKISSSDRQGHIRSAGIVHQIVRRAVATLHVPDSNVRKNRLDALKFLLDANPGKSYNLGEQFSDQKQTALHIAALAGDLNVVECLLEVSGDINTVDASENTALHYAAMLQDLGPGSEKTSGLIRQNKEIIVKLLLEKGGDVSCVNGMGEKFADLATQNNIRFETPSPHQESRRSKLEPS